MRQSFLITLLCLSLSGFSQVSKTLTIGEPAPNFIISVGPNSIRSFLMPQTNRIVLLHFWSSESPLSRENGRNLSKLLQRYQNTEYKSAEGFDVIAIAVQNNFKSWEHAISEDSIGNFTNGLALKEFNDEVCLNYGIKEVPANILVDENGVVIAIGPTMLALENILDEMKNYQPVRKDISGKLARSSGLGNVLANRKVYLLNGYGDSLSKTITDFNGQFRFIDIKLGQDLSIKADVPSNILNPDPPALYSPYGEYLMNGRAVGDGFSFHLPARAAKALTLRDTIPTSPLSGQLYITKNLAFKNEGKELTAKSEDELKVILSYLQKNRKLKLQIVTHTDARIDQESAMALTTRQALAIRSYLVKKGIQEYRITPVARGNSNLRKMCGSKTECTEEEHKLNRRVELQLYSD
jgi:outer membrane protein OmpA-like peptidoglycan-associated protein